MKLFLTNLPFIFSESDLRNLLEKCCTIVYLKLMTDHASGCSKGIAFLQTATAA